MVSFSFHRSALRAGFLLAAALAFTACDSGGGGGDDGAPNAVAGSDQTVDVGTRVTLNASGSTDPEGDALTYAWAFQTRPSGSSANLSSTSGATVTFTPDVAGTYVARVTVSDGMNTDTDDVAITAVQSECIDFDEDVGEDLTLSAGRYCVPAGERLSVDGAALTLSPGVRIDFGVGAELSIADDAAIIARGTASQPISLQGAQPTAGSWRGVVVFSNDVRNEMDYVSVAHGGSDRNAFLNAAANLAVDNDARIELTNSTFRDGAGVGLQVDPSGKLPSFTSNTFSGNADAGVQVNFDAATQLDAGSAYAVNGDAYVSVYDSDLTADGTLTALDAPYRLSGRNEVNDALLTVAPGARLLFDAGAEVIIASDAAIRAVGTAAEPITMLGQQPTAGYWRGVTVFSNDVRNAMAYVTVAHGGSDRNAFLNAAANLAIDNSAQVTLTNSTIRDGGGVGLQADPGAKLPGFASNTFSGNTDAGVQVNFTAATQLDAGSAYAVNGDAYVSVYDSDLGTDATLTSLDAPYRFDGRVEVDDALLTVAPGARLLFSANAELSISGDAAIDAVGTAAAGISFRGEQPTAGYWRGIVVFSNDIRNRMDYVTIAYGGSDRNAFLNEPANLSLDNDVRMTITNSSITDSQGWGIQADPGVVLVQTSNTFSNNALGNVNQD